MLERQPMKSLMMSFKKVKTVSSMLEACLNLLETCLNMSVTCYAGYDRWCGPFMVWLESSCELESSETRQGRCQTWAINGHQVSSAGFHGRSSWDHQELDFRVQGREGNGHQPGGYCNKALQVSSKSGADQVSSKKPDSMHSQVVQRIYRNSGVWWP